MSETVPESAIEALRIAVQAMGNQSAFARATGATQQSVSYWLKHRKPIAAEFVLAAEKATGISRHFLRPDIFGELAPDAPAVAYDRDALLHPKAGA